MVLTPAAVKRYYDRSGTFQDRQGFYEDRALEALLAHGAFDEAGAIVEIGCGTGRFARQLLSLAPSVAYDGFDVSPTMIGIAEGRLTEMRDRARLHLVDPGTVRLPLAAESADRVVSTYVMDLLSPADIRTVLEEAHRVLRPGGRLCLVSLTTGGTVVSRVVTALWTFVFHLRPQLVGGCRPIELARFLADVSWEVLYKAVVVSWGIPSEVVIARRRAT